jgi:hypothetical protein
MACAPYLVSRKKRKIKHNTLATTNQFCSVGTAISVGTQNVVMSNIVFNGTSSMVIHCNGDMIVTGNLIVNGSLTVNNGTVTVNTGNASDDVKKIIKEIKELQLDKLKELGLVFRKSLKRYRAIDKAMNIATNLECYGELKSELDNIWDVIKNIAGRQAYNIRDAAWDAVVAMATKDEITKDEFALLYRSYFLISLASNQGDNNVKE